MIAANDNLRTLSAEERSSWIERLRDEFDILCIGQPTPDRIERELAALGYL